ncbi:Transmembrane protein [Melia azedarach]|uniref:Transmembrane protein n=1 Tax=Melia azedarach TaxID=155640 RepID=A0ACC1Y602_MELAZ|nr:Transmembrane protein [Melia azedarach]
MIGFFFSFVSSSGDEKREEKKKPSISDMMISTFSVYTTPINRSYWGKLKALMNHAQAYFFAPNLDFRGSEEAEAINGATGEKKVREAVARSVERRKETVEEPAKSAYEIAGKTMKKTKDQFKKSFNLYLFLNFV